MKIPKHLLLGMDLSPADAALLAWMRFFTETVGVPERITLLHNIYIEVDWMEAHGQSYRSSEVCAAIQADLEEKLERASWPEELRARTSVHVTQNESTARAIQDQVKQEDIDTVIFGRKTYYPGRGGMFKRLLRTLRVLDQVILVPESAPYMLERLLIPVDFSKRSLELAQSGIRYCQKHEIKPILCHVYRLPQVYFPFIPIDKLSEKKATEVEEQMADFVSQLESPLPVRTLTQYAENQSVSEGIRMIAAQERADLILMARKPKSALEDVMIDDTLLQLISSPVDLPIWIDK